MRDYEKVLKVAMDSGVLLLTNGAEIYRVEESMQRILKAYGLEEADIFAIPHMIQATIVTPSKHSITRIRRVYVRDSNFDRLAAVNDLVREICATTPSMEDAAEKLAAVRKRPIYHSGQRILFSALTGFFFTFLFQGRLPDAGVTALAVTLSRLICFQMERFHANSFFVTIVASLVHTVTALSLGIWFPDLQTDKIIMGTLMILVPGVTFTTALRDIIAKDLLAGTIEGVEAMLVGSAIAIGSALGFSLVGELWRFLI